MALTNAHVRVNALRFEDHEFYLRFKDRDYSIEGELLEKPNSTEERYCRRRRQKMDTKIPSMIGSDGTPSLRDWLGASISVVTSF